MSAPTMWVYYVDIHNDNNYIGTCDSLHVDKFYVDM